MQEVEEKKDKIEQWENEMLPEVNSKWENPEVRRRDDGDGGGWRRHSAATPLWRQARAATFSRNVRRSPSNQFSPPPPPLIIIIIILLAFNGLDPYFINYKIDFNA